VLAEFKMVAGWICVKPPPVSRDIISPIRLSGGWIRLGSL